MVKFTTYSQLNPAGGRRRTSCKNSVKWPGSPWVLLAQWIERPPGVQKIMDSNPIRISTQIFFLGPTLMLHFFHIYLPSCNFTISSFITIIVHHQIFWDSYWFKLITWRDSVHHQPHCAPPRAGKFEIVLGRICLFCFSNFTFGFYGLHLKKLTTIRIDFWASARKKIEWWTNKENRVLMSRNRW